VVESAPVSRVLTVSKRASALVFVVSISSRGLIIRKVPSARIPHVSRPSVHFSRHGILGEVGYAGGDVQV